MHVPWSLIERSTASNARVAWHEVRVARASCASFRLVGAEFGLERPFDCVIATSGQDYALERPCRLREAASSYVHATRSHVHASRTYVRTTSMYVRAGMLQSVRDATVRQARYAAQTHCSARRVAEESFV
jgi:hypothetical protein